MVAIQEQIPLKDFTTIKLGGAARYFCSCTDIDQIKEALSFVQKKSFRSEIISGGSNIIFMDSGFDGVVIKIDLMGISFNEEGSTVLAVVQAGENWESFVRTSVQKGYGGIECLSGIPGSVGATPIQNVGAYGQEVQDTIEYVQMIDRRSMEVLRFENIDCGFSYRQSRFKSLDRGKYIVTEVAFRLTKNGRPVIRYPELQKQIDVNTEFLQLSEGRESLEAVRNVVISLRKKKSMIIDPNDPNSRSVGSFFLNPIVTKEKFAEVEEYWKNSDHPSKIPVYPFMENMKIPAAWLIEQSGFAKGYKINGVGISENHSLALVNYHGTTESLLELAEAIKSAVEKTFSIRLELEPNIVK